MTIKEVCTDFIKKNNLSGENSTGTLYYKTYFDKKGKVSGTVIYSYGPHFPLAVKIKDFYIFNEKRYSDTTARHQYWLLHKISEARKNIIYCNTEITDHIATFVILRCGVMMVDCSTSFDTFDRSATMYANMNINKLMNKLKKARAERSISAYNQEIKRYNQSNMNLIDFKKSI